VAHESIPNSTRGNEYLANERTFLAWIRTSIAVMSLGFVVARFSLWLREIAAETILGGLLAILAGWRYHAVNRAIERDRVRPDRWLIVLATVSVALLAFIMAGVILVLSGKTP
jgi:putative membrane protein